MDFCTGLDDWQ